MRHLEQPYRCIHERGNACYVVHRFNLAQILRPALKNRGNAPRVWYRVSRGFPSFPPPFFPLPRSIYTSLSIFNRLVVAYRFFRSTIPSSRSGKRKDNDFSLFFFFFFFFSFLHRSSFHVVVEKEREKKKLLALQVVHAFML